MTYGPENILHIRRGKRTDVPALQTLSFAVAGSIHTEHDQLATHDLTKQEIQHWRRLASDPALDFYVAEQAGSLQGMVLVCYLRSLHNRGWRASLDITILASAAEEIGQALLDFAKARARKRGCQLMYLQACNAPGLGNAELGHLSVSRVV